MENDEMDIDGSWYAASVREAAFDAAPPPPPPPPPQQAAPAQPPPPPFPSSSSQVPPPQQPAPPSLPNLPPLRYGRTTQQQQQVAPAPRQGSLLGRARFPSAQRIGGPTRGLDRRPRPRSLLENAQNRQRQAVGISTKNAPAPLRGILRNSQQPRADLRRSIHRAPPVTGKRSYVEFVEPDESSPPLPPTPSIKSRMTGAKTASPKRPLFTTDRGHPAYQPPPPAEERRGGEGLRRIPGMFISLCDAATGVLTAIMDYFMADLFDEEDDDEPQMVGVETDSTGKKRRAIHAKSASSPDDKPSRAPLLPPSDPSKMPGDFPKQDSPLVDAADVSGTTPAITSSGTTPINASPTSTPRHTELTDSSPKGDQTEEPTPKEMTPINTSPTSTLRHTELTDPRPKSSQTEEPTPKSDDFLENWLPKGPPPKHLRRFDEWPKPNLAPPVGPPLSPSKYESKKNGRSSGSGTRPSSSGTRPPSNGSRPPSSGSGFFQARLSPRTVREKARLAAKAKFADMKSKVVLKKGISKTRPIMTCPRSPPDPKVQALKAKLAEGWARRFPGVPHQDRVHDALNKQRGQVVGRLPLPTINIKPSPIRHKHPNGMEFTDAEERAFMNKQKDDDVDALVNKAQLASIETSEEHELRSSWQGRKKAQEAEKAEEAARQKAQEEDEQAESDAKEAEEAAEQKAKKDAEEAHLAEEARVKEDARAKEEVRIQLANEREQASIDAAAEKLRKDDAAWQALSPSEQHRRFEEAQKELEGVPFPEDNTWGSIDESGWASRQAIIRAIGQEWDEKIAESMKIKSDQHVIVKTVDGTSLTRHDFGTLIPDNSWLNDEIVNAWMATLVQSKLDQTGYVKKADRVPDFAAFTNAWYTNYKQKGIKGIETWSRRKNIKGEKLLKADKIFFPINTGAHWLLLIISPGTKTIEVLDSMQSNSNKMKFARIAREWLQMELKDKYVEGEWTLLDSLSCQQLNTDDCGVFTCFNALASAKDAGFDCVGQGSTSNARRMMAAILINGGFHGEWRL